MIVMDVNARCVISLINHGPVVSVSCETLSGNSDFLWKQIGFLTGRIFPEAINEKEKIAGAIYRIQASLDYERQKSRERSPLYNSARHINLNRVMQKLLLMQGSI